MTESTFTSLEQLGEWDLATRGRGLHVTARIGTGEDARPAVRECRDAALGWVAHRLGEDLPRRAWRHQSFQWDGNGSTCRVVRERGGRGDFWAARLTRPSGADRPAETELVVAAPRDGTDPTIGVRVPGWPASANQEADTLPPAVLRHIAAAVPLLLHGAPIIREPNAVWTPQAMQDFIATLLDPGRRLPVVVITEPTYGGDAHALLAQSERVADALTGLATVTVLPQRFTYTLSDTVTKMLSVYDGAWRIYLPGFSHGARRFDHPVYLRERLEEPGGVERATREVFRVVGDHHVRSVAEDGIRFDSVRPREERLAGVTRQVRAAWRRILGAMLAAASGLAGAPGRWLERRRRARRAAATRTAASGDPPRPLEPAGGPTAAGPEKVRPAAEPTPLEPAAAEAREDTAVLRRDLEGVRRDLRTERQKNKTLAGERDRARELEAAAREERDGARRDARRLEGLVRLLGGDPKTPFPVSWEEVPGWCASTLEGRVVLSESVRRGLGGAPFEDVALAVSCLYWLGHEYREARLGGGDAHLYGLIPGLANGIRNERCGGDSFQVEWRGKRHSVDWHLKNGGNTRDPRRCLRIYYFWDSGRREVVIASMPAHRRTAMT